MEPKTRLASAVQGLGINSLHMSDNDLRDRFFRERRLLLGVSVVLLAHQLLGITVERSAETLGLRFDIEDPSKIWWAVWAVWLWTAVCVVQQLNSIKLRSEYPKNRDDEIRDRLSDWAVTRMVRRAAMKHLRVNVPRQMKPTFEVTYVGRSESTGPQQERFVYTGVSIAARWQCNDGNAAAAKAAELDKAMEARGWQSPTSGSVGIEGVECTFSRTVRVRVVPIRDEWLIRSTATTWTVLSTSFATDYVMPLIIGAAPMMIAMGHGIARAVSACR